MGLLEFINAEELARIAELEEENKTLKNQLILQQQYCKEQQEQDDYIAQLTQHLAILEQSLTEQTSCSENWMTHSKQLEQDFDKQLAYNDQLSEVCTQHEQHIQQLEQKFEQQTSKVKQKAIEYEKTETAYRDEINKLNQYVAAHESADLEHDQERLELQNQLRLLQAQISENNLKISDYQTQLTEVATYRDQLNFREHGINEPNFEYLNSETYKQEIRKLREAQKELVRNNESMTESGLISLSGSYTKGEKLSQGIQKLSLRAFNGACADLIGSVRWNNYERALLQLEAAFISINKCGETADIAITEEYKELKLRELKLTHEYQLRKHEEKETQRLVRAKMQEDLRAQKANQAAQIKAEKEEQAYKKALQQAKADIEHLEGEKRITMQARITELEQQLRKVSNIKERAKSMAQQTKRGYVYVISNVGSFGKNVVKIGMTRRINPEERILELGDASVPFRFDTHALIYTEDAPALEARLHQKLEACRLNKVNLRREFFHANLNTIEAALKEEYPDIEFIHQTDAYEWRASNGS